MRGLMLAMSLSALTMSAYGRDLGNIGPVYPIGEEDFITFIHQRLNSMQQSGALKALQNTLIKRVHQNAITPPPVAGITQTEKTHTLYYDPTIVVTRNVSLPNGKVIVKAGQKVNPLKTVKLIETLVFINGDSKAQLKWAEHHLHSYHNVKLILVKGNIYKTFKTLHRRIYFDQDGLITRKLGIWHVPAVVTQDGLRLKIEEIKP